MGMLIIDARPLMPEVLQELVPTSMHENIQNISKLVRQWTEGESLFDGEGEELRVAQIGGRTVGVGGVVKCRDFSGALRVTRFYVHPEFRNRGIATAIAVHLIKNASQFADVVTCNAQASVQATPFWESLGFLRIEHPGITHKLQIDKTLQI